MTEAAVELALRHVPGSGPVDLQPLQTGIVNQSFRVMRDGRMFAMRVGSAATAELGMDREWERRVLQQVTQARLAPEVRACLPQDGVLVTDWVLGSIWSDEEAQSSAATLQMAQLMRMIHAVRAPVLARAMSPARWIELYQNALRRHPLDPSTSSRLSMFTAHASRLQPVYQRFGPRPQVLCHSDLHRQNLLQCEGRLIVLDWEYAHVGDPFWDLAGWLTMNEGATPGEQRETLIREYLGRSPREEERQRLALLMWFFDLVGWLWCRLFACVRGESLAADVLMRAGVIEARLSAAAE